MRPPFLERFEQVKPAGDERWRATCPLCGGRRAFSISALGDRGWVANCFAAAKDTAHVREALAIVGLRFDDLLHENESRPRRGGGNTSPVRVSPLTSHSSGKRSIEVDELLRRAEADEFEPDRVELPPFPPGTPSVARTVARFYQRVRGVRLWAGIDEPGDATPFGCDWVAARLGLPSITVWRALAWLCRAGILAGSGERRELRLYLPGDTNVVPLRRREAS